jgi:hypothetical protein
VPLPCPTSRRCGAIRPYNAGRGGGSGFTEGGLPADGMKPFGGHRPRWDGRHGFDAHGHDRGGRRTANPRASPSRRRLASRVLGDPRGRSRARGSLRRGRSKRAAGRDGDSRSRSARGRPLGGAGAPRLPSSPPRVGLFHPGGARSARGTARSQGTLGVSMGGPPRTPCAPNDGPEPFARTDRAGSATSHLSSDARPLRRAPPAALPDAPSGGPLAR